MSGKKIPILAVIVPMKPLHLAKQRLRATLTDEQREQLALRMFEHVLATVTHSRIAALAAVVSADDHVLDRARLRGFSPVREDRPGYNRAVRQGVDWALSEGANAVLILPADLPQLTPADLHALAGLASRPGPVVAVAPDAHHRGTNALLLRPPDVLSPSFGVDSFRRHCQIARDLGMIPAIFDSPSLSHDVDWPEDVQYSDFPQMQHL